MGGRHFHVHKAILAGRWGMGHSNGGRGWALVLLFLSVFALWGFDFEMFFLVRVSCVDLIEYGVWWVVWF